MSAPTCIETGCSTPADYELNRSGLFCTKCEMARRERISSQFAALTSSRPALSGVQVEPNEEGDGNGC